LSGGAKSFQDSFGDLLLAMILGIFVAYMVLASQFNSYIHPVTILMALPFSLSGAFLALLVTHQSLNIYSMIGLILLMGIVKKNSILLVDFTNRVRERGGGVTEALLEACPIRLRPILMTSTAILASALPVALAIGPGAESRVPMAVTIIGGVLVSTILTLFVVPCVYSLFSHLEGKSAHHLQIIPVAEPAQAVPDLSEPATPRTSSRKRGARRKK
jgi:HAE1 family hydrophobic/amphiphilic exporter-1